MLSSSIKHPTSKPLVGYNGYLAVHDSYLMVLFKMRRDGRFVSDVLFDMWREGWPTELRGILSRAIAVFLLKSEDRGEERVDGYGYGEWIAGWL